MQVTVRDLYEHLVDYGLYEGNDSEYSSLKNAVKAWRLGWYKNPDLPQIPFYAIYDERGLRTTKVGRQPSRKLAEPLNPDQREKQRRFAVYIMNHYDLEKLRQQPLDEPDPSEWFPPDEVESE